MALLSRVGLFRFCLSEIPMPVLDIVTMRGTMPQSCVSGRSMVAMDGLVGIDANSSPAICKWW